MPHRCLTACAELLTVLYEALYLRMTFSMYVIIQPLKRRQRKQVFLKNKLYRSGTSPPLTIFYIKNFFVLRILKSGLGFNLPDLSYSIGWIIPIHCKPGATSVPYSTTTVILTVQPLQCGDAILCMLFHSRHASDRFPLTILQITNTVHSQQGGLLKCLDSTYHESESLSSALSIPFSGMPSDRTMFCSEVTAWPICKLLYC